MYESTKDRLENISVLFQDCPETPVCRWRLLQLVVLGALSTSVKDVNFLPTSLLMLVPLGSMMKGVYGLWNINLEIKHAFSCLLQNNKMFEIEKLNVEGGYQQFGTATLQLKIISYMLLRSNGMQGQHHIKNVISTYNWHAIEFQMHGLFHIVPKGELCIISHDPL